MITIHYAKCQHGLLTEEWGFALAGARFGPRAIRAASARQTSFRGFNPRAGINPYRGWARILDCGDIPASPMDNALALRQLSAAYEELGDRAPADPREQAAGRGPRLITLGGDHSLSLPALRALVKVHGPVRVLHFDAHLDTWHPAKYPSAWPSEQAHFNHGSSKCCFSLSPFFPHRTRLDPGETGCLETGRRAAVGTGHS